MKPFNILASTTRIWNPGDNFIFFGCRRLIDSALMQFLGEHVALYSAFDRNAHIAKSGTANNRPNVFLPGDEYAGIDLILIAGTPDWGKSAESLYFDSVTKNIPLIALGLGAETAEHLESHVTDTVVLGLREALLVTTRDRIAHAYLNDLGIENTLTCCPASWAPGELPYMSAMHPVAVVSSDVRAIMAEAIQKAQELNCPIICHNSYERDHLAARGIIPLYDEDPLRLLRIITSFRKLYSGRLHAALPALAMGIDVELLDSCSARVKEGFATAREFLPDGNAFTEQLAAVHSALQQIVR